MNKILFLKALIGFLTFLIFLTLVGIVYGIVNYNKTPKLFSKNKTTAVTVKNVVYLGMPETKIKTAFGCGDRLCVLLTEKGNKDVVAVIEPEKPQKFYFISPDAAPAK